MKKYLYILSLFMVTQTAFSQAVINELYTDPGNTSGKSEFIELYNSSVSAQDLDCYSILTYWEAGTAKGWYVLDLPPVILAPKKWYVLASSNVFDVQSSTGVTASLNWNAMPAGAYLKKFQLTGNGYTEVGAGLVTDLLVDVSPAGVSGHNYFTFLYRNGTLVNAFWGGGASGTLPAGIRNMPDLTISPAGTCAAVYNLNFSGMPAAEFVNQTPGSDNGYARTSDGKCGAWAKTAAGSGHTPGISNGSATGKSGSLVTAQTLACNTSPGFSTINYNITGLSGSVTETDDFPVEVQLYFDNGTTPGQLDGGDTYQDSQPDYSVTEPQKSFSIPAMQNAILVYRTKRGCFDKVVALANGCSPLPVGLVNFTAIRNYNSVSLKWMTAFEQNALGFNVERNTKGNWQEIGFVPTQAHNGSSLDEHYYEFSEPNAETGITQYRIKEVDMGGKFKYSIIRAVYGIGQSGKTTIFPNPAIDGTVNVVFSDNRTVRNVSLIDLNGRIVRQWSNTTTNNIQIQNLNPGIYSLRVMVPESGDQTVERIVVAGH